MKSNASLFRRHAAAEELMLRSVMPIVSAADLSPLDDRRAVRTVPVLKISVADRMVARG